MLIFYFVLLWILFLVQILSLASQGWIFLSVALGFYSVWSVLQSENSQELLTLCKCDFLFNTLKEYVQLYLFLNLLLEMGHPAESFIT